MTIGLTPDAMTSGDGPFSVSDESAAAGDGMWTGVRLMRDRSTSDTSDTIMVYTDVEESMDVGLLETIGASGRGFVVITSNNGRIEKIGLGDDSLPGTTTTHHEDGTTTTIYPENLEFDGTYENISGTFKCVGGSCQITDGEDGLEFASNSATITNRIRFEPDNPDATYSKPAETYSYFGWWYEAAGDPEKITDLQPFHGGVGNNVTVTTTMAVTGTADYTGDAHGRYMTMTYDEEGKLDEAKHGLFEATAMLTAEFGDDAASLGTISGEVKEFQVMDGDQVMDWSVKLKKAVIGMNGETDALFSGGSSHTNAGAWKAEFHDSGETSSDAPGTITGIFDALLGSQGLLTGGFGAKLDTSSPAEQ